MVYNIKMGPKKGALKDRQKKSLRYTTPEGKTPDTGLYYSGQAEDEFYTLFV